MDFSEYALESKEELTALANAIKQKIGKPDNLTVLQMKAEVEGIEVGGGEVVEPVIIPLEITENDTYTAPEGVDGYSPITVNVAGGSGATVASLIDGSVKEISIPQGVEKIRSGIFKNCYDLESVTIPDTVTQIEEQAFAFTGLKSIVFPRSLTDLGDRAVSDCYSIRTIAFRGTPNAIPSMAFYLCPSHIYVPWREGDLMYAPWGAYDATIHYCKYNRVVGLGYYIEFTGYGSVEYYCIEKPDGEVLRYQGSPPVLIDGVGEATYGWTSTSGIDENDDVYNGYFCDTFRFTEPGRFYFWTETADGVVASYAVYNVVEAPVNRVDFSIDYSYSYCAEAGMTWAEWCDSGYNTDGFRIEGNSVLTAWGDTVTTYFTSPISVSPSDVITANTYGLQYAIPSV